MAKRSVIFSVVASSVLFGGAALASEAQEDMVPPEATFMYGVPYGTSHGSNGQYVESGTYYNSAPVYTKTGTGGTTWSLYRRADGKWYVDFNAVSEDWDGTVAHTTASQAFPWTTAAWADDVISFRTQQVYVNGVPYAQYGSNGDYEFSGQIYNKAPVYTKAGTGGTTWSLYKRANGKWHVDFNAVSEDWDGTIAHGTAAAAWPWATTWNGAGQLAFLTKTVYLYQTPYAQLGSEGEWTFDGEFYNNMPVYERDVAGTTWSLYRRADGKWYVDFNARSEDWNGTVAYSTSAATWPWDTGWNGTTIAFRQNSLTAQGAPYSSAGSAGTYYFNGTIYNDAPVYERTAGGTTWSIYVRENGNWHFDFNAVSEDWNGTVAYTTAASSWPWSGTWNSSATAVCQNIDR